MLMRTCCWQQPDRAAALAGGQPGVRLLRRLLLAAAEPLCVSSAEAASSAEWLTLLLGEVCGSGHVLARLYHALGVVGQQQAGEGDAQPRTMEQGLLLHGLAQAVELRQHAAEDELAVR
jgi:hypothetical protein